MSRVVETTLKYFVEFQTSDGSWVPSQSALPEYTSFTEAEKKYDGLSQLPHLHYRLIQRATETVVIETVLAES